MAADGSSWQDRGTGGKNFSTAAAPERPVYNPTALNGRPGFVFDGINDSFTATPSPLMVGIGAFTFWLVSRRGTVNINNSTLATATELVHYTDDMVYGVVGNGAGTYVRTTAITNAFHYMTFTFNAGTCHLYVDGVDKALTITGPIPVTTFSTGLMYAGYLLGTWLNCTICEAGMVNRLLNASELTLLHGYLAQKYAL